MDQDSPARTERLLGSVTIGQASRPDITPILQAALAGDCQVGIVVPLAEQVASEIGKFSILSKTPLCEAASRYDDFNIVAWAAQTLRERSAQMLWLDCMGFVEEHRRVAREASGLPVLASNTLVAKLTAEMMS